MVIRCGLAINILPKGPMLTKGPKIIGLNATLNMIVIMTTANSSLLGSRGFKVETWKGWASISVY
jgi:hypothetical protein